MFTIRRILGLALIFSLLLGNFGVVQAQTSDSKYFPETGHWVTGDFYTFYEATSEPELVFGYPITEAYRDVRSGMTVQYFQRARFELAPEKTAGQRVSMTAVGTSLYKAGSSPLKMSSSFSCRTFKQTGFAVCFAFLDFFDDYGGVAQFGNPISGFEIYNGRIVQWFERARFEWFPELPEGQKVSLADLGRVYFDSIPEDPKLLSPVKRDALTGSQVLKLQPRMFVSKAVTRQSDEQQVYVIVQDQTLTPVYNANVVLTVQWADGTEGKVSLVTDKNGIAAAKLTFKNQPFGKLVTIVAEVSYGDLTEKTTTSFRVWW